MAHFTIYKASAGSGKTYTLVKRLLVFMLRSPENFDKALAITFTNKAAAEMKYRIVRRLQSIVSGQESEYVQSLAEELKYSPEQIIRNAKVLFENILHRYSGFHVSTIDAFFQRLIRAFARELNLSFNYTLELDTNEVLEQVVSQTIEKAGDDKALTGWLLDFMRDHTDDGNSWDISYKIKNFGNEIFKEKFIEIESQMADKDIRKTIRELRSALYQEIKTFEDKLHEYVKQVLDILNKHGMQPNEFKYKGGSGLLGYLNNFSPDKKSYSFTPGGRLSGAIDDPFTLLPTDPESEAKAESCIDDDMFDVIADSFIYRDQHIGRYNTAKEAVRNLYQFGLLDDLNRELAQYRKENRVLLISDANRILAQLTRQTQVPFIYEKIGTHFRYYLLDEFQDTSDKQWASLLPLISEAVSQGNKVLLVGDAKQSIYRWRGGNLNLIRRKVYDDFALANPHIETLQLTQNWRSLPNVILFNNALFHSIPNCLPEITGIDADILFDDVFEDVQQEIPKKHECNGYVSFCFLENNESETWKEKALYQIPAIIDRQMELGYDMKDMAILVRKNSDGEMIADYLNDLEKEYRIISPDSLIAGNSQTVQFIIDTLAWMNNPGESITQKAVISGYLMFFGNQSQTVTHEVLQQENGFADWLKNITGKHPEAFVSLKSRPLPVVIRQLMQWFSIYGFLDAYVEVLLDKAEDYYVSKSHSLTDFLTWWDEKGCNEKVVLPENENAIQIMTIHKAKGLEFQIVIAPFLDDKFGFSNFNKDILWLHTDEPPFNMLPALPIHYFDYNKESLFSGQLEGEFRAMVLDKVNLAYVTFTRAVDKLYCFMPYPMTKKGEINKSVPGLIYSVFENGEFENWDNETFIYESGNEDEQKRIVQNKPEETDTMISTPVEPDLNIQPKIRMNNTLQEMPGNTEMNQMESGKFIHKALSMIKYVGDLEKTLKQILHEGRATPEEIEALRTLIKGLFKDEQIKNWYSKEWQVMAEREILLPETGFLRPDRVIIRDNKAIVIDYKTGAQKESHKDQVRYYCTVMRQMGYSSVEGYLLYTNENQVVKVEG